MNIPIESQPIKLSYKAMNIRAMDDVIRGRVDVIAAWVRDVVQVLSCQQEAVLVVVSAVRGSAPRTAGTAMVVTLSDVFGTIGGGALEFEAIGKARAALAGGGLTTHTSTPLGPSLDQCCGGRVDLLYRLVKLADLPLFQEIEASGASLKLPHDPAGPLLLADAGDGPCNEADCFVLTAQMPHHRVVLYGAGHVGRALVAALAPLPFTITWVDDRQAIFPRDLPASVRAVSAALPEAIALDQPETAFHLVLTHSHAVDLEIVSAVLKRNKFSFLGLIGSTTKRARFLSLLGERGLGDVARARLTCPIGIAGIDDKRPEVIAASVAAQLLRLEKASRPESG